MRLFSTHSVAKSLVYTATLYACDKETAPGRVEHQGLITSSSILTTFTTYRTNWNIDVRKIGDISVDFRNVDLSVFETKRVSDRVLYKLDYSLNVIFGAQEGVLKFEARADGQVIGKTSVDFARALFY
jgi:hypothetical protein